ELAAPSSEAVAAAEAYAARVVAEDGVQYLDVPGLVDVMKRRADQAVYLFDVRTANEYAAGHVPGFRGFPGGQAVQRSDDLAVVKHCPIVFGCDRLARATLIASWYRQMGFRDVYAVRGGTEAWTTSGRSLEHGTMDDRPAGEDEARSMVTLVDARRLQASPPPAVLFVGTSQDFARGHLPGARWAPRGWLELWLADLVPSTETPRAVACAH